MERFIARQPIFNCERVVYGYELLFRSGPENYFSHPRPDAACASTADNFFLFGVETLTQGRRAFVNCTREFLMRGYATLLPKDRIVLEILETVELDREVVGVCRSLKKSGYLIALDDFVESPPWRPLMSIADFIKMDVLSSSQEELRRMARQFAHSGVKLLAEKVETHDDFQRMRDWGYSYFQGYFFSRPQMLTHHDVPAFKLNYLRILQATNRSQIDIEEVAERIKSEISLSYRLLRYLNSPALFLACEIRSIPQALVMLGQRGIRKWISLMVIACMGDDKPEELVLLPLIRAKFCELLAPHTGLTAEADDLFLLGLLSVLDAILDMAMPEILKEIAIRAEIRDALLGKKNKFREVFDLVQRYEAGSWDELAVVASAMSLEKERIPSLYLQAVDWAKALTAGPNVEMTEATAGSLGSALGG